MYNEFDKFVDLCNDENNNKKPVSWYQYRKVLGRVDDKTIIDKLGMHDMSRIIFVIQKKYCRRAHWKDIGDDWEIRCKRAVIGRASYQSATVHFINIENNNLIIEGESSIPACFPEDASAVLAEVNGELIRTEYTGYNGDKKLFSEVYEYCRSFKVCIPLSDSILKIRFSFEVDKKIINYRTISAQRFSPVAGVIPEQYAFRNGYVMQIEGDTLVVSPVKCIENYEKNYLKHISEDIAKLRKEAFEYIKLKKRPVWLFADRLNDADDSARVLFEYVNKNKLPADSFFILSSSASQYDEISKYGKTVEPFSRQHLLLYLVCDMVISSQCNGVIENPFLNKCEEVRDLYHNHKIVFLQHGVIKDDMSEVLNRFNTGIDVFITSADKEWQSIVNGNYNYTCEQVWLTGLPRFDRLVSEGENTVLIMPTWRREYMHNVWDEDIKDYVWRPNDRFYTSRYYLRWSRFLNSKYIKYIHEKTKFEFVFAPHPLVKRYFKINDDGFLKVAKSDSYKDLYSGASILITDYSSAVFDGVYLNKPVIYYQFDKKEFYKNHTYKKGYFDYHKDGFGPVCRTNFSLFFMLLCLSSDVKWINNKYKKRADTFLKFRDNKCCERICNRLIEL